MTFPKRITFQWLVRTVPTIESAAEYEELIDELVRRRWIQHPAWQFGSNFMGLLDHLLPTWVMTEVVGRRAQRATAEAARRAA